MQEQEVITQQYNMDDLTPEEMQKRLAWYDKKYGPYIDKRGLSNWRNLFRMPNILEWTIFAMIVLVLFMGWAYSHDVAQCREVINNLPTLACTYCQQITQGNLNNIKSSFNLDNQTLTFSNTSLMLKEEYTLSPT